MGTKINLFEIPAMLNMAAEMLKATVGNLPDEQKQEFENKLKEKGINNNDLIGINEGAEKLKNAFKKLTLEQNNFLNSELIKQNYPEKMQELKNKIAQFNKIKF